MWIDKEQTLVENRNKDTWQLPVVSDEGDYLGNVIAQIVQPSECMVRYLLVYSPQGHYLLPSDTVVHIEDKVYCEVSADQFQQLPRYSAGISKQDQEEIYEVLAQPPYWEVENR